MPLDFLVEPQLLFPTSLIVFFPLILLIWPSAEAIIVVLPPFIIFLLSSYFDYIGILLGPCLFCSPLFLVACYASLTHQGQHIAIDGHFTLSFPQITSIMMYASNLMGAGVDIEHNMPSLDLSVYKLRRLILLLLVTNPTHGDIIFKYYLTSFCVDWGGQLVYYLLTWEGPYFLLSYRMYDSYASTSRILAFLNRFWSAMFYIGCI